MKNRTSRQEGGRVGLAGTAIVGLFALSLRSPVSGRAESYGTLFPCFIDIPGWEGREPEGMKVILLPREKLWAVLSLCLDVLRETESLKLARSFDWNLIKRKAGYFK